MENSSRKCRICADFGQNQTKLPRHYLRKQDLERSDEDLCDKCLFEIKQHVFNVKELIECEILHNVQYIEQCVLEVFSPRLSRTLTPRQYSEHFKLYF